jgi:hypothetical protein
MTDVNPRRTNEFEPNRIRGIYYCYTEPGADASTLAHVEDHRDDDPEHTDSDSNNGRHDTTQSSCSG